MSSGRGSHYCNDLRVRSINGNDVFYCGRSYDLFVSEPVSFSDWLSFEESIFRGDSGLPCMGFGDRDCSLDP